MKPKIVEVDTSTGTVKNRVMTDEEFAQYEADLEAAPQ